MYEVEFPEWIEVSDGLRDLVSKLLCKSRVKRLGY